jgi:hypothetical protein
VWRAIAAESTGTTALAILVALAVSVALAEDFKTLNGKEYKSATVIRVEADGIIIRTADGISKIYFVELPKDVADKWLAPIRAAEAAAEQQRVEAKKAAEQQRIAAEQQRVEAKKAVEQQRLEAENAAEQQRTEKEKQPNADLKRAVEQFEAAEQRAAQAYQSAIKGTVSGQVFIHSSGGENFKLGAVQVGLFSRDAIDAVLAELKRYADFKIQELSPLVDTKRADSKSDKYYKLLIDRASYYHGSFYFSYLQNPIQTAETDADGKFVLNVPKQGSSVLAAKSQRYVRKTFIGDMGIDHASAIGSGNSESSLRLLPDRLSRAITPTISHPTSVAAARASTAAARKNFRRLRDISPQNRSRGRLSS